MNNSSCPDKFLKSLQKVRQKIRFRDALFPDCYIWRRVLVYIWLFLVPFSRNIILSATSQRPCQTLLIVFTKKSTCVSFFHQTKTCKKNLALSYLNHVHKIMLIFRLCFKYAHKSSPSNIIKSNVCVACKYFGREEYAEDYLSRWCALYISCGFVSVPGNSDV